MLANATSLGQFYQVRVGSGLSRHSEEGRDVREGMHRP